MSEWPRLLASTLVLGVLLPAGDTPLAADAIADGVCAALQRARAQADAPRFERRPALDRAAASRAAELATLPLERRMGKRRALESHLRDTGTETYLRVREHVDMKRGYARPTVSFLETWREYGEAWRTVMDPAWDAIGAASIRAEDGFWILVVVMLQDPRIDRDVASLERDVVESVNRLRAERKLSPLRPYPPLANVARGHSREMVRLGFFDHHSPISGEPAERAASAGVRFDLLAENIQANNDPDDPVAAAVRSWMGSRAHRRNVLDARFTHTGVGVAVAADGTYYFTQLFLVPRE